MQNYANFSILPVPSAEVEAWRMEAERKAEETLHRLNNVVELDNF
ncbi:hypothetical protein FACS189429_7840 [Bacteroidia bacterium]|nr:hypothetical protein FACS189429_7840 [Bacteroidia bacterium]